MAVPDIRFAIKAVNETATAFRETREQALATRTAIEGVNAAGAKTVGVVGAVRSSAVEAKALLAGMVGGLTALAGTELFYELPRAFKEAVDRIAELGDQAEKLGIPLKTLQELQYGADRTHVPLETLNHALETFGVNVAKAEAGGGDLLRTFKDNGISLRDASGKQKDYNRLFADYIELIEHARDPASRLLLIQQGFGKGADDLAEMLRDGVDGLNRLAEARDKASPLLDEADVQRAKDLQKAFDDLGQSAKQAFDSIVLAVSGPVSSALRELAGTISEIAQTIALMQKGDFGGAAKLALFGNAHASGADIADTLLGGAPDLGAMQRYMDAQRTGLAGGPPDAAGLLDQTGLDLAALRGGSKAPALTVHPAYDVMAVNQAFLADQAMNLPGGFTRTHTDTGGGGRRSGGQSEIEAIAGVYDALRRQRQALTETDREQEIANNLARAHVAAASADGQEIARQTGLIFDQEKALRSADEAAQSFGDSIYDALDGVIFRGEKGRDVLRQLLTQLGEAALKSALLGEGPLAGLSGTASQRSGVPGGLVGSLLGAFFTGSHATGGAIPAGMWGTASENEAVMATPGGGAVIIPPRGQTAGSGKLEVNVTVNGARGNREISDMVREGVSAGVGQSLRSVRAGLPQMLADIKYRGR